MSLNPIGYGYNKPQRKPSRAKRYTRRDKHGRKYLKKLILSRKGGD